MENRISRTVIITICILVVLFFVVFAVIKIYKELKIESGVVKTTTKEETTKENETEEATKDESKVSPEDIIKAYYKYVDEGEFEKAYELLDPSYIPSRESLDVFVKGMQRAWAGAKVVSIQPIAEWLKQKDLPQPSHTIETEDKKWFAVEMDMKWKKDWIPVVPEGVNLVFIEVVKKGNIWKISMMGSSY